MVKIIMVKEENMLIKQSLGIKKRGKLPYPIGNFPLFNTVAKWQIIPIELTTTNHRRHSDLTVVSHF